MRYTLYRQVIIPLQQSLFYSATSCKWSYLCRFGGVLGSEWANMARILKHKLFNINQCTVRLTRVVWEKEVESWSHLLGTVGEL